MDTIETDVMVIKMYYKDAGSMLLERRRKTFVTPCWW